MDAFDIGLRGTLNQVQGDSERVIAYASRALNRAESNYYITVVLYHKELLAVRFFIEYV